MWKNRIFLCMLAVLVKHSLTLDYDDDRLEKDEIINAINDADTTWRAARNFHPSLKLQYARVLLGQRKDTNRVALPELEDSDDDTDLPETFDARDKWRDCIGLQTIRDQGSCGSCWAVSSTSAFTDRLCIASKGKFNRQLSAVDLVSCGPGGGCHGGDMLEAFQYFETKGIVTGGDYDSHQGCQPYPFPKCDHRRINGGKYNPCTPDYLPTPECHINKCTNKNYRQHSFKQDLHFIKPNSSFQISGTAIVKKIQRELYKNGPLVAGLDVYQDFLSYSSGVYYHRNGSILGGHAVKVIGWGVENDTDYWLVANSWNESWGDKGFFKIKRGSNECQFESEVVGGMPTVNIVG